MKKKFLSMALIGAMVLSLAACGGSGSSSSSDTSSDAGESTDTSSSSSGDALQVVIWDTNQQAGLQEICDDFTAETGIEAKVEVKDWDSYWTLLESGASGGSLPDVFWMHSNNSQMYMKNDMLLQLDDYIDASDTIDLDNYMDEITELYTMDGKHYAVPKDYDTIALWYNKTMFDEAGLSYPDDSWSWDDLLEAAKALTKDDGSQYGFAFNPSNDQDTYYNWVYANDGYIVNDDHSASGYDDAKTLEAMDFTSDLLQYCPPSTTMSETGTDVLFESGQVAMITQGSWMINSFYTAENHDDYYWALLPYADVNGNGTCDSGERYSAYNGLGWAASAKVKDPESCYSLIAYLCGEEGQKLQSEKGVTMGGMKGVSDTFANAFEGMDVSAFIKAEEFSLYFRPYTRNTTVWEDALQQKGAFLDPWQNPEDPALMSTACDNAQKIIEDAIAKE